MNAKYVFNTYLSLLYFDIYRLMYTERKSKEAKKQLMCQNVYMTQSGKAQNFEMQHTQGSAQSQTNLSKSHFHNSQPGSSQPHKQQIAHKSLSLWRLLTHWGIIFVSIIAFFTVFFAILISLGARSEYADLTPKPASSAEQERQKLAIFAQRIAASQDLSLQAAEVAKQAQIWLDHLGGVWMPWPEGAPEGYENPPIDTSAYSSIDQLRQAVWNFSSIALSAYTDTESTDQTPDNFKMNAIESAEDENNSDSARRTLAEIGLDAIYAGIALDREAGVQPNCEAPNTENLAAALSSYPDTLKNLDTARQWLEYQTALSPSDDLSAQVNTLNTLIDTALDAGTPDTRQVMAPPPTHSDRAATLVYAALKEWITHTTAAKERIAATNTACILAKTIRK